MANWLATRLVSSDGFVKAILKQARAVDKKGMGFPVAELLAKALLLRGRGGALLASKLSRSVPIQGCLTVVVCFKGFEDA